MTEIIAAFPCLGKTTMSKRFPEKVLDFETLDYFFERTGFEKLTDEEFKGLPNRIQKKRWFRSIHKRSNSKLQIKTI